MTSHEYAKKAQELAEFLLSRPEFETGAELVYMFCHHYTKEGFVQAVRGVGAGKKVFTGENIEFESSHAPEGTYIRVEAPRDKVCKLVRAAEWDCEPLLSPEEAEELGKVAESDLTPF